MLHCKREDRSSLRDVCLLMACTASALLQQGSWGESKAGVKAKHECSDPFQPTLRHAGILIVA